MTLKCAILALACSVLLTSCETIKEIRENKVLDKVGSFQLNPVQPNNYWYDGKSYEYNKYQIEIFASPGRAHIILDGRYIGDTPLLYKYTGKLDRDDRVTFRVVPFDESVRPFEHVLKINDELPRKINFGLTKNGE